MGERLIVSGSGRIHTYACPPQAPGASCALEGAGALCAAGGSIFAASDQDNAIWRLDGETLAPTGVYAGGPGMAQLITSPDGGYLYALCSEADSLLMLSAKTGSPLMLTRVGVNPCAMAMDERGEIIAVAGGACGEVLLLCARSLSLVARLATCGMVFSAAIAPDAVYALSLSESMDSVLTAFLPGGVRRELALAGMPGALAVLPQGVAAATHRAVFFMPCGAAAVYRRLDAPGRAGRLLIHPQGLLMTDVWSDSLFWRAPSARAWRRVAQGVRDAALW